MIKYISILITCLVMHGCSKTNAQTDVGAAMVMCEHPNEFGNIGDGPYSKHNIELDFVRWYVNDVHIKDTPNCRGTTLIVDFVGPGVVKAQSWLNGIPSEKSIGMVKNFKAITVYPPSPPIIISVINEA